MATQTFEEYLDKIAADNDLTSIQLGRMPVGDRIVRTATVHYAGHTRGGICCQSGDSDTSVREALYQAIEKAQADRAPIAYVPCAVPAMDVVAA